MAETTEPHADAGVEAMRRAIHDGAAFLEECGRDLMAASAHAAFRRLGIITGDWETVDAARLYTFALKSALTTAEAERDQWKEAAESTLREIDRITERMEGRRAAVEAMTPRRAPSTGGTP